MMTPEPKLRSLCERFWERPSRSSFGSPKNRRRNGSLEKGDMSGPFGCLTVFVVKMLTTLGATFFTTGEKLVVNFVSRASGVSLTTTGTEAFAFFWPANGQSKARPVETRANAPPAAVARTIASNLFCSFLIVFLVCDLSPTSAARATVRNSPSLFVGGSSSLVVLISFILSGKELTGSLQLQR
jgi:hypothetical protein